nr:MAG TPA: hypothetical protein [Caudoviricetes sp.]
MITISAFISTIPVVWIFGRRYLYALFQAQGTCLAITFPLQSF